MLHPKYSGISVYSSGPRWVGQYRDAKGLIVRVSLGSKATTPKAEARRRAKRLEAQLEGSPHLVDPTASPPLGQWLDDVIRAAEHEQRPATIAGYEQTRDKLLGYLSPKVQLSRITRADADGWSTWLRTHKFQADGVKGGEPYRLSRFSVKRYLVTARAMFQRAVDTDLIAFNPFDRVKMPAVQVRSFETVPVDDVERLAGVLAEPLARAVLIARYAGLRRNEIIRMEWDWVDSASISVRAEDDIETTKQRARKVPVVPALAAHMRAWREADRGKGRVYRGSTNNVERDIKAGMVAAGLDPWEKPLHTLRKNCQQDWLAQYPEPDVAKWMGNSPLVGRIHYHKVESQAFQQATSVPNRVPTP